MFDAKSQILTLLETIHGVLVTGAYPKSFERLPHISFYETVNSEGLPQLPGLLTDISIQVDIWHNKSTGGLAQQVDVLMNSIGFRRQFASDLPDPSGVNRKTMRYHGIVDRRSERVSQ
ncbi:MAG: hypothetical protein K6T85_02820 [Gorillibacterium sp.]|nr:hypothetical protein [Gorillibacterium sp.]